MKNYIKEISSLINIEGVGQEEVENLMSIIPNGDRGDFALPCFSFSKKLGKAPKDIADMLSQNIKKNDFIEKVESVNGYLNFYLTRQKIANEVIEEVLTNDEVYKDTIGEGKTVCIDYSSVNLAKYMHIGHMSTTAIGESIARLLENFGYRVIRINHVGDYGTPFGKMVAAYNLWGNDQDIKDRGVDATQDLYVKFNRESYENEDLIKLARSVFLDIENKKGKNYETYKWFLEISIKEAKNILDYFNVSFDSWRGEAAFTDCLKDVVNELDSKRITKISDGAKIIDLEDYGLGISLIEKSDGSSLYITRDIAAAQYRYKKYKFDEMIYVTAVEQKLHFAQLFKIMELMGYEYSKNMKHVYYGMFSLSTGKISSREGRQAALVDLLKIAEDKVENIIFNKNYSKEKKEKIKSAISKSALIYGAIKNDTNKDSVLDIGRAFNVEGDTSSYILYSYVRICSILKKYNNPTDIRADYGYITNNESFDLIKHIINFKETLLSFMNEYEPSILCKKIMSIAKDFNKFYSNHKVIVDNPEETMAKIALLKSIKKTMEFGLNILNIPIIDEM